MRISANHPHNKAHSIDHLGEARNYWWNDDFLALLAERMDWADCTRAADIGCGRGLMTFHLADFLPEGAEIFGFDIESAHLKVARQRAKKVQKRQKVSISFAEGDAHGLPYETDDMDLTLCQTLLIHVPEPLSVLEEMKRITRPGGWVVAMEPNNLVSQFMLDRYEQTDYDIQDVLGMMEVRMRCELGKKRLGEGYNSLGDVLPDLFQKVGLEDTQVWISDKAFSLIPPYDTKEQRLRVAEMIQWIEHGEGGFGYEDNLRYYLAGGGRKDDFGVYWHQISLYQQTLLQQLKDQTFISAGGNLMYIVAGRVPEEE
ncbi:MAG: class I SAM-dependent methyltransferase [Bacteroidota bacterium]